MVHRIPQDTGVVENGKRHLINKSAMKSIFQFQMQDLISASSFYV